MEKRHPTTNKVFNLRKRCKVATIPLVQQFQEDIDSIIDKYREEGLTLSEAIGTIELTKLDLWHEVQED